MLTKKTFILYWSWLNVIQQGDLHEYLKKHKLDMNRKIQILKQICKGIQYIHDMNILHRDIKMKNIFVFSNNKVKIGDFGISKNFSAEDQYAQTAIGTPFYLSPEICSVIYGAWVVCFMNLLQKKDLLMEILLMLFKKEIILKIINNDYTKIQTKIDSRLKNLIYKMLSTDPEQRPRIQDILKCKIFRNQSQILQKKAIKSSTNLDYFKGTFNQPEQSLLLGKHKKQMSFECLNLKSDSLPSNNFRVSSILGFMRNYSNSKIKSARENSMSCSQLSLQKAQNSHRKDKFFLDVVQCENRRSRLSSSSTKFQNYFIGQQAKPKPQKVLDFSSKLFSNKNLSVKRLMITNQFLQYKLGKEKFTQVRNLFQQKNFTQKQLEQIIGQDNIMYKKILDYNFITKTPSTKYSVEVTIKRAYEEIKILRGLSKKKSFINEQKKQNSEDFQSTRPSGQQYSQDFSDFNQFWETSGKQFTYEQRKEYERIKQSFENIKDINEGQLTIIDIELPDVEKRLNLEKLRVRIKEQPSGSQEPMYVFENSMYLNELKKNIQQKIQKYQQGKIDAKLVYFRQKKILEKQNKDIQEQQDIENKQAYFEKFKTSKINQFYNIMDKDFEQEVRNKFKLDQECEERYTVLSGYYLETLKEEIIAQRKVNKLLKLLRSTEVISEPEFLREQISQQIIQQKFAEYNLLQSIFMEDNNENDTDNNCNNKEITQLKKFIKLLIDQNKNQKEKFNQQEEYLVKLNDKIQQLKFTNSTQDQIIDMQMLANQAMVQSQQYSIQIQNDDIEKIIQKFNEGKLDEINLQYQTSLEEQIDKNFILLQNKKLLSQNFYLQEQINDLRCQLFQKYQDYLEKNAEIETAISAEYNNRNSQQKSMESDNQNTNSFNNQSSRKHDSNIYLDINHKQQSQRSNQNYPNSHQSGSYKDQTYDTKNFHSFNPQDQEKQQYQQYSQRQNQTKDINNDNRTGSQKFQDSKKQIHNDTPLTQNNSQQDVPLSNNNHGYIQQMSLNNQDNQNQSPGNSLLLYRKSIADTQRKNNQNINNMIQMYQQQVQQANNNSVANQNQLLEFNKILLQEQEDLLQNLKFYQDKQIIYMENLEEITNLFQSDVKALQLNEENHKNYLIQQKYLLEYKQQFLNELNEKAYQVQKNLNVIQKTNLDMRDFFQNEDFQNYQRFLTESELSQFKEESKKYVQNNNRLKEQLKITEENDLQIQNDESFIQNKLNQQKQYNQQQRIQEQYQFLMEFLQKDFQLNQRRSQLKQQQQQLGIIKNQQNTNFRRNSSIIKQINSIQKSRTLDMTLQDFDNVQGEDSIRDTQEKLDNMADSSQQHRSTGRNSNQIGSSQFYTFQQLKGQSISQDKQGNQSQFQQNNYFDQVNESQNNNQSQTDTYVQDKHKQVDDSAFSKQDQVEDSNYDQQDQINDSNYDQQDQVNDSNYSNKNQENTIKQNNFNDSFFNNTEQQQQNSQKENQGFNQHTANLSFVNQQNQEDQNNYAVEQGGDDSNFFDIPQKNETNQKNNESEDSYSIRLHKDTQDFNKEDDEISQNSGNTRKNLQKYISRHDTQYTNITQNSKNKNNDQNQSHGTQDQTEQRQTQDFQNSNDTDEYSNHLNSQQTEPKSIFSNTKDQYRQHDQFHGTLSPTTTQMDNKQQFPNQNFSHEQNNIDYSQQNQKYFSNQQLQEQQDKNFSKKQEEVNYFDDGQEYNNQIQQNTNHYQSNSQQQQQKIINYTQQNMQIYQKQKEDEELIRLNEEFFALQNSIKRVENFLNQRPFNIEKIENVPKSMLDLVNDIEELKFDISIANKELQQTKTKFEQMQQNPQTCYNKFSELGIYKDVQSLKNIVGLLETKAQYIERQSIRNI